jgi:hypothetical protein
MSYVRFTARAMPITPNPSAGKYFIAFDTNNSNHLTVQDSTGSLADLQSGSSFTPEDAQDAVASAFLDTATINFTYNDVANTMQCDAIPGGIDHDALLNFVANEHVDHTSVSVNTVSNSGLAGGGNISANRNLSIDLTNLPAYGEPANLDNGLLALVYDSNDTTHKSIPRRFLAAINPDLYYVQADDFIGTTLGGLTSTITGTGASAQAGSYGLVTGESVFGIVQVDTGTTATGRSFLTSSNNTQLFKNSTTSMRLRVRYALEALSTGVETFFQKIGFGVGFAAGDPANGLYFQYNEAQNGGRYELISRVSSVTTQQVDTGITADLDYHVFDIRWYMDGSARGYIDGVLVGTITAGNPPNSVSIGFGFGIEKTLGAGQRNANADWYAIEIFRDAAR